MDYQQALKLIKEHIPEPDASALCSWIAAIADRGKSGGAPECPNCSVPGRPFAMRPIPPDFVKLENATHECSKCGFKVYQAEI